MTEQTIKRTLDVDVDGLKGLITYTIKEMYDMIDEEGFGEIKFRTIDEFTLTFGEVEAEEVRQGHSMKTEIYREYGISE